MINMINMNSGYDGYSMSKRAVSAYNAGKVPFYQLPYCVGKIGKPNLDRFVSSCEWHHTSKYCNRTDFYNVEEVLATFGIEASEEYKPNPEAIEFLKDFKATPPSTITSFIAKKVTWLEWSGSRKYPTATSRELHNVQVFTKNNKTFTFYDGNVKITKRAGTNGFDIER